MLPAVQVELVQQFDREEVDEDKQEKRHGVNNGNVEPDVDDATEGLVGANAGH